MTIDLGHFREYLYLASQGTIPALSVAKEWLATYQSLMILAASFWRFYFNEGRSTRNGKGGYNSPGAISVLAAIMSFVGASVLFGIIVYWLLEGLPDSTDLTVASLQADVICFKVLVLVWLGYPVVAFAPRLGHWGVPGDKYNATWSTLKDLGFAFLDVTSKGGLALFFILRASWVDAAEENALVAAGELALNITGH